MYAQHGVDMSLALRARDRAPAPAAAPPAGPAAPLRRRQKKNRNHRSNAPARRAIVVAAPPAPVVQATIDPPAIVLPEAAGIHEAALEVPAPCV